MKHLLLYGLSISLLIGNSGCEKSDAATSPLTCSFTLLNEQGQAATTFTQGQNIIFQFQINNPTDHDIRLSNPPFDDSDFLKVVRVSSGEGSAIVGKPYKQVFCTYQLGVALPAHQTITLSIPWMEASAFPTSLYFCGHANTTYLPVGHYRTSFTTPLTILHVNQSDEVTEKQEFSYEFDVK